MRTELCDKVVELICSTDVFDGIKAIAAGGSVGTLEKSIYEIDNDLDLFVVADGMKYNKENLEKQLNKMLGTYYSDITYYESLKFEHLQHSKNLSQCDFDNLRSKYVLYGSLQQPANEGQVVKQSSAATVLLTRLWCLLAHSKLNSNQVFVPRDINASELQIKKAVSAIIDSQLIIRGIYDYATGL